MASEHLRACLTATDLGSYADDICDKLDLLLPFLSTQQDLVRRLAELGVSKLGHRFRIAKMIGEAAQASTPIAPDVSDASAPPAPQATTTNATAISSPAATAAPVAQRWQVTHVPAVIIRSAPSVTAAKLGSRATGTEVRVEREVNGWVRLADDDPSGREMWMLVDGTQAGFKGPLMRLVPPDVAAILDEARRLKRDAMRSVPQANDAGSDMAARLRLKLGPTVRSALALLDRALDVLLTLPETHRAGEMAGVKHEMAIIHARIVPENLLLPAILTQAEMHRLVDRQVRVNDAAAAAVAGACQVLHEPPLGVPHGVSVVPLHACAWEVMYYASESLAHLSPDQLIDPGAQSARSSRSLPVAPAISP